MGAKEFSRLDDGVEVALANPQKVAFLDTEGHGDQGDLYELVASALFTMLADAKVIAVSCSSLPPFYALVSSFSTLQMLPRTPS